MENPSDDPREFHAGLEGDEAGLGGMPGGANTFMGAFAYTLYFRHYPA